MSSRNSDETGIRYEWYALQRYGSNYFGEFEKKKIVWLEISDKANYAYDDKAMYLTNSAYFLTGENLKYILAILNSRVSDFYFFQITAKIAGGRKRYTKQYVSQARIPTIHVKKQKQFVELVEKILKAKKQNSQLVVKQLEQQIDNMVYKLYELAYKEVLVVQPNFADVMSKKEYESFEIGE